MPLVQEYFILQVFGAESYPPHSKRADAAVPAVESFLTLKFLKICNAEYVKKFFRMYMNFWTMLSHMFLCSRLQQVRLESG